MTADIDIYGVFVPALLIVALLAAAATTLIQRLLVAVRFYRFVWHRSLFDLALFFVVLGVIFLLVNSRPGEAFP